MANALTPDELGPRLAEIYRVLGPLYRTVQRRVEHDESVMGMSVGVRAVLDALAGQSPATVPDLARRLDLSRQFVQRMVNDALEVRWIQARANPAHRRSSLMSLTPGGEQAIAQVLAREHSMMSRVRGDITNNDIDTTFRVLQEMLDTVNRLETNRRPIAPRHQRNRVAERRTGTEHSRRRQSSSTPASTAAPEGIG